MMHRLYVVLAASALALIAASAPGDTGAPAPAGTRVLPVDSISGITGFFNLAQGAVRIVAVVSPTAPECTAGIDSMKALFARDSSRRLRAFVVFVPVSDTDSPTAALERTGYLSDRRIVAFWNQNGSLADAFGPLTSTGARVWNGYFVYDTDATFEGPRPAKPELALHPGSTATIEGGDLAARTGALLQAFEQMRRETQKATE